MMLRHGEQFIRHFEAGEHATRAVLRDLMVDLGKLGVSGDDLANVELILAEALNNVAEHAYSDVSGPVELSVELRRNGLACIIADRGHAIPGGIAPNPGLPALDGDLPEGGFGWHIIRCLTRDLNYQRQAGWNRLTMFVPWDDFA